MWADKEELLNMQTRKKKLLNMQANKEELLNKGDRGRALKLLLVINHNPSE